MGNLCRRRLKNPRKEESMGQKRSENYLDIGSHPQDNKSQEIIKAQKQEIEKLKNENSSLKMRLGEGVEAKNWNVRFPVNAKIII